MMEKWTGSWPVSYTHLYHHFEDAVWMVDAPCIRDIEQDFQHTLEPVSYTHLDPQRDRLVL